jgi:hypothetical protein
MKPYESYEGNNLKNLIPREIAIVPAGANKKKIFLCKFDDNPKQGTQKMKKETALKLIKAGGLSDAEVAEILASCADADKVEVQKAIDAAKAPASAPGVITLDEKTMDVLVEKVGKALRKESLSKLSEIAATLKTACEKLDGMCSAGDKGGEGADGEKPVKKIDVSKIPEDKELSDEEMAALAQSMNAEEVAA